MKYSIKTVERLPKQLWHHKLAVGRALTSFASVLLFALASPAAAQVKEWDPGLPKDLFKSGPPGRLRDAKCKACEDAMAKLQAALDDWYAMELSEGQQDKKDAVSIMDTAANKAKNDEGNAKINEAMAGLGQPKDKGKAAQKRQQENSAKDAKQKENKGKSAKDILKDRIKNLLKELEDCEKAKCPPPEQPGQPGQPEGPGEKPVQPGGGEQPGGAKPPSAPGEEQLPSLPPGDCWPSQEAKDQFYKDLKDAEEELQSDIEMSDHFDPNRKSQGAAKILAKMKEAKTVRAAADKIAKICPPPKGGGGAQAPGPGKGKPKAPPKVKTGGNVSLPEDSFCALISDNKIKIDTAGTGETIGHVADLTVENVTDEPLTVVVPPLILESRSGRNQPYGCRNGETVEVPPHESKTVPLDGVCLARNKPPVPKGVTGDLLVNNCDGGSQIPKEKAERMLHLVKSKYDAADRLEEDGKLKEIPYKDKKKRKDIVVQWSTWMDPEICEITGATPATKDDLKKVVYKQLEEKGPMTPETKKKVDQGIDTIFEKVELTTDKAKDLEKQDQYAQAEPGGGTFEISDNQGQSTESPPPQTQEKPKKDKKDKKGKKNKTIMFLEQFDWWIEFTKKWPKPILDWIEKKFVAEWADQNKQKATDDYNRKLKDYFDQSKHHGELEKARDDAKQKAEAPGATQQDKDNYQKAQNELNKNEDALKQDFNKTNDGKKAFDKMYDAEKTANKAHDAEKDASKGIDPDTKKAVEEFWKESPPPEDMTHPSGPVPGL
jgi:hypothetical protein